MKKFLYIIILLFSLSYYSNSQLAFSIGPLLKPVLMNNEVVVLTGMRAGATISKNYFIGLSLDGITIDTYSPDVKDKIYEIYPNLDLSKIGIDFDYHFNTDDFLYYSLGIISGLSLIKFDMAYYIENSTNNLYNPDYKTNKMFLFIEPKFSFNLNFKDFYKVIFGLSYLYVFTNGTDYDNLISNNNKFRLESNKVSGLSLFFAVTFGSY